MAESNRNDFRVWQMLFEYDDFVSMSYMAYKLNMMPRSVRRVIEREDSPLIVIDNEGCPAAKVVGTPAERAALFEQIGMKCCKVSPECCTAIRKALSTPTTLPQLVSETGYSRYEIISAIQVMMDVDAREHTGRRVYELKVDGCTQT